MSIRLIPERTRLSTKTTVQNNAYVGLEGEITHDNSQDTITLHKGDGSNVVMATVQAFGTIQASINASLASASAALVSEQADCDQHTRGIEKGR